LRIARIVTIITGIGMILFAYLVPVLGGAVNAYLTIIAIMDMPLFIIAVIYGLLWKRTNWQGAISGYAAGAIAGIIGQFYFHFDFNLTTFITASVTLIVTPIISRFTECPAIGKIETIWNAKQISDEEVKSNDVYYIMPKTRRGKISLSILICGFAFFLLGVILGSTGSPWASMVAVSGMVVYFLGGLLRAYSN